MSKSECQNSINLEDFEDARQTHAMGSLWREKSNTERPDRSLADLTPAGYAATCERYLPIEELPTEPLPDEQPFR
jgi:hypothetical protein